MDSVERVAVDEELGVGFSMGKIATAFAVVQLEMRTIRATREIKAPTVSGLVVNVNNFFLAPALISVANATTRCS